jgi:hypothetical protein
MTEPKSRIIGLELGSDLSDEQTAAQLETAAAQVPAALQTGVSE